MSDVVNNSIMPKDRQFLLYLAGVEIPATDATVSFGTFRFPEISVSVPADPLLHRIGADDRLPLAIFYQDHWAYSKPTYCLLAEGELSGWGYQRTGVSRSITLQAIDPMSVLTSLFLFFISDVDTALGNRADRKQADAAGTSVFLNSLPLGFFYRFLQKSGETVKRPIDILLNILGSISGFVGGFPAYSKSKQVADLITKTNAAATLRKKVTGPDIFREAMALRDVGAPSSQDSKEGPTQFSSPGLVRWAAKKNGITLPGPSAQALFDFCKSKNTTTTALLAADLPGALMFESATNDPQKITSVSVVATGRNAIGVFTQDIKNTKDETFNKIHEAVARNESQGNPGVVILDQFGKTGRPAGIAVGLLQHNQRVGTLFEICAEMRAKNSKKFNETMGGTGTIGTEMFFSKGKFRVFPFHENAVYWFPKFAELFSDPEFVQLQYEFDRKKYYDPIVPIAKKFGVDTERGLVMLMDTAVHMSPRTAGQLLAKAVRESGGLSANKRKVLTRFGYHADRYGISKGQTWKRREKLAADPQWSDVLRTEGKKSGEIVRAGIRNIPQAQNWRKVVAYALIPGVDYTKSAPPSTFSKNAETIKFTGGMFGGNSQLNPQNQSAARILQLGTDKKAKIKDILRQKFPGRRNYTGAQQQAAEKAFTEQNPKHAARVASAKRVAQAQVALKRTMKRAQIAVQFFMRWMQKTKIKQHIVASPILEETIDSGNGDGIFPVLGAMKRENVVKALTGFSQATSGRAGSMWDFLRQIYQIGLWELGFILAPPALVTDTDHVIKGRLAGSTSGKATIASYVSKPNMYFGLPPSGNVWFPSMLEAVNFSENYATQPTRTYIDDTTLASTYHLDKKNDSFNYFATAKAAYPPECDGALFNSPHKNKNNKDLVVFPEELYKGPVTNRHKTPSWFYYLYKETTKGRKTAASKPRTDKKGAPAVIVKVITDKDTKDGTQHGARGAIYKKGGVSYILPYANDTKTQSKAPVFSQVGYFNGKPVRFNATNVEGQIIHAEAAKGYLQLKAAAKKAGISITIKYGFRTAAEQVAITDGTSATRPGFDLHQGGGAIVLNVPSSQTKKLREFLFANAQKFGFEGFNNAAFRMESVKARKDLRQISRNAAQADVTLGKSNPKIVLSILDARVFKLLYEKSARRSTRQNDPEHNTYYNYAKFEHFREKYSSRTAALSGVFNPYTTAGFPAYVFDTDKTNFHLAGTVVSGQHSLSNAGQASTSANLTFVRTFHEMFEQALIEKDGFPIGPADSIAAVSDATQRIPSARRYYGQLFYGGADFKGKDPLGDYQKLLGWANVGAPPDKIVAEPTKTGYNLDKEFNREIEVLPQARRYFEDTNAALSYCARPVCTIEEYIDFYLGVRRTSAHPGDKINHLGGLDMKFYYQIRDFTYGAGILSDPTEFGLSKKEAYDRLSTLPPTIRDWQTALLLYRQKIYRNETGI